MPTPSSHTRWTRVRTVVNWLNLSTPTGLLIARFGGARIVPASRGTLLATQYRWRFPVASAFTVGSVIISRHDEQWFARRPRLVAHEDRHVTQYAWSLGVLLVPMYMVSMAVSWLLAGDQSSFNVHERLAGLEDGGYRRRPLRFARRDR